MGVFRQRAHASALVEGPSWDWPAQLGSGSGVYDTPFRSSGPPPRTGVVALRPLLKLAWPIASHASCSGDGGVGFRAATPPSGVCFGLGHSTKTYRRPSVPAGGRKSGGRDKPQCITCCITLTQLAHSCRRSRQQSCSCASTNFQTGVLFSSRLRLAAPPH